jgi:hypothetical protein
MYTDQGISYCNEDGHSSFWITIVGKTIFGKKEIENRDCPACLKQLNEYKTCELCVGNDIETNKLNVLVKELKDKDIKNRKSIKELNDKDMHYNKSIKEYKYILYN